MRQRKQAMDGAASRMPSGASDICRMDGEPQDGAIAAGPLVHGVRDGQIAPARSAAIATRQAVGVAAAGVDPGDDADAASIKSVGLE